MSKSQEELDIISLGKAAERLLLNEDWITVIENAYASEALKRAKYSFNGSTGEIDSLKAVSSLFGHIELLISQAKILQIKD